MTDHDQLLAAVFNAVSPYLSDEAPPNAVIREAIDEALRAATAARAEPVDRRQFVQRLGDAIAEQLDQIDVRAIAEAVAGSATPTCKVCDRPAHKVDSRWWHHPDDHGPTVHAPVVAGSATPEEETP